MPKFRGYCELRIPWKACWGGLSPEYCGDSALELCDPRLGSLLEEEEGRCQGSGAEIKTVRDQCRTTPGDQGKGKGLGDGKLSGHIEPIQAGK